MKRIAYLAALVFHAIRLRSWARAAWVCDYEGRKWK